MASDAAVSRRLWGVSFKPSAAAAGSKLSRRKLRFLSGVEFADGKTSFAAAAKSSLRTRRPARASVGDARSREAGSDPSVSNTHFLGTA